MNSISLFRLVALKHALALEIKGLRRRGRSAYSIIMTEFGYRGNREQVLDQFNQYLNNLTKGE